MVLLTQGTQLEPSKKNQPLTKYFLFSLGLLFFICAHFFQRNLGEVGLNFPFNALSWISLSLAIGVSFYHITKQKCIRYTSLTLILFIAVLFLSIPLLNPDASSSSVMGRFIGLWAGFLFFCCLQQFPFSNTQKRGLLWFIIISVLIETLFAYVQYFILEPENIAKYDTIINYPYGIFQQVNVMATFLATGLAIANYLLIKQPIKYKNNVLIVTLLYLVPILVLPIIFILASLIGWLTTLLSLLLLSPYMWKYSTKRRFLMWFIAIIIGAIGGAALAQLPSLNNDNNSINATSQVALISQKTDLESPRHDSIPQALDMFLEKPIIGYGYGNFEANYILYTAKQHQISPSYPPGIPNLTHPHNEIIYWAVEGGILSVLGLLIAAVGVLLRIKKYKPVTRLALLALLAPIFIHTQLEYPFYHSMVHWIIFIILLFWIDQGCASYKTYRLTDVTKIPLKISSFLIPFITTIYMVTVLQSNWVLTKFETTKPADLTLLNQVTNPITWANRLDWDRLITQLIIGVQTQNVTLIQPYITWSEKIIKSKPRPDYYKNLILAYQAIGKPQKAEDIRREAMFLFPLYHFETFNLQKNQKKNRNAIK